MTILEKEKVQMKYSNIWKIQFKEESIQRRIGEDKRNEQLAYLFYNFNCFLTFRIYLKAKKC